MTLLAWFQRRNCIVATDAWPGLKEPILGAMSYTWNDKTMDEILEGEGCTGRLVKTNELSIFKQIGYIVKMVVWF